jgi:rhodanese-related sulfurtransferase
VSDPLPVEIDCHATQLLLQDDDSCCLLDCRESDEHQLVHIAQARLVPMSQIQERIDELSSLKDQRLIVHCHHGGRSLKVARWLRDLGFTHAQSMAGGIDAWARESDTSLARY